MGRNEPSILQSDFSLSDVPGMANGAVKVAQELRSVVSVFCWLVILLVHSHAAHAVIHIQVSEQRNGIAYVQGATTLGVAAISWEGKRVGKSGTNGRFSFYGTRPADCVGELTDGDQSAEIDIAGCNPDPVAPLANTGQTVSYSPADDGELQKGLSTAPDPRFSDNQDGTITDNLTGLIWLADANCLATLIPSHRGPMAWQDGLGFVGDLNNGVYDCSDTSNQGSHQVDWRLPNVKELHSLVNYGEYDSALTPGHPFLNVTGGGSYWTSTSGHEDAGDAWFVRLLNGRLSRESKETLNFVLPVRGTTQ